MHTKKKKVRKEWCHGFQGKGQGYELSLRTGIHYLENLNTKYEHCSSYGLQVTHLTLNLSHLNARRVNRLLHENRKSIPKFFKC